MQGGFEKTRVNLVERPWAIDNLDEILQRWKEKPHHKAMLFVDNAGTDVVLGKMLQLPCLCRVITVNLLSKMS